jgi:hypothetical protein
MSRATNCTKCLSRTEPQIEPQYCSNLRLKSEDTGKTERNSTDVGEHRRRSTGALSRGARSGSGGGLAGHGGGRTASLAHARRSGSGTGGGSGGGGDRRESDTRGLAEVDGDLGDLCCVR